MSRQRRKYVFYCKPNAGLVDAWLPVIMRLKHSDVGADVVFVAYDFRVLLDLSHNEALVNISAKTFVSFYAVLGGRLIGMDDVFYLIEFARRTRYLRSNRVLFHSPDIVKRFFLFLHVLICYLVPKLRVLDMISLAGSVDGEFSDAAFFVDKFSLMLSSLPRYSLPHGFHTVSSHHKTPSFYESLEDMRSSLSPRDVVFALNDNEAEFYSDHFPSVNLFRVAPPKHDSHWVAYLQSLVDTRKYFSGRPFVVLLSKAGGNARLSTAKRERFIRIVRDVVIDDVGLPVLVKLHPVERDVNTYYRAFGREDYGATWCFSNDHPLALSKNALLAISFMSTSCLDFIAANVPVVELSNSDGMSEDDKRDYYGDDSQSQSRGYYRDNGLVLGADDATGLRSALNSVMFDRNNALIPLRKAFGRCVYHSRDSVGFISDIINHHCNNDDKGTCYSRR